MGAALSELFDLDLRKWRSRDPADPRLDASLSFLSPKSGVTGVTSAPSDSWVTRKGVAVTTGEVRGSVFVQMGCVENFTDILVEIVE